MVSKRTVIVTMVFLFLVGLAVLFYPYYQGAKADREMASKADAFLHSVQIGQSETTNDDSESPAEEEPEKERLYPKLWEAMESYNHRIYTNKQANLKNTEAYKTPAFHLSAFGSEDNIFGVIEIPKLDVRLPIYLGANRENMAKGAVHLGETSLPIGGENTNSVIAGHCGWNGAHYFRYLSDLEPGDEVIITNLWETLTYTVTETEIIEPNETDAILIQEGRDMLTLLTCHPYASGGRQRLLVFCDREKGEMNGTS